MDLNHIPQFSWSCWTSIVFHSLAGHVGPCHVCQTLQASEQSKMVVRIWRVEPALALQGPAFNLLDEGKKETPYHCA
ncbi:hypothetical protein WAH63_21170, partial [Acinetobacter baumannii]